MLHINKQTKYKLLYNILEHITEAYSVKYLYWQYGNASGWINGQYPEQWNNEEAKRFDELVTKLVEQKEIELRMNS